MPDLITHWNDVLLDVMRDVKGAPAPLARGGAMMHAAIFDAVNSVVRSHEPYLIAVDAPHSASIDAAVSYAAHDALAAAFPGTNVDLRAVRDTVLAGSSASVVDIAAGKAVGEAAASAMIEARLDDRSDDATPYVPSTARGQWRPTDTNPATTPYWRLVTPFCLDDGTQFRPPRPGGYESVTELLASQEYAAQLNEVKELGEASSTSRTPEQTEIAFFWANDQDGTYKPPGHLFSVTQEVSAARNLNLVENARLFALVALALADAAVASWDAKYGMTIDLWRPETAIAEAGSDGNGATTPQAGWEPLSTNAQGGHFSPAFPAYVSGHATFAGAHAAVLRAFFGTDNVTFTVTSEDPNATGPRTFSAFSAMALENARSRVYLGVHFQWDGDHGVLTGTAVGDHVAATRLRPVGVLAAA